MPSTVLLAIALWVAADPVDDAARVEQLVHQTQVRPAVPAKGVARGTPKPDADAALLGQKVRVRTVDGGLYGGTLQSVDAVNIVLRIALPQRVLDYTLPRSGVSGIEAAQATP
jgi:hypothetical protein